MREHPDDDVDDDEREEADREQSCGPTAQDGGHQQTQLNVRSLLLGRTQRVLSLVLTYDTSPPANNTSLARSGIGSKAALVFRSGDSSVFRERSKRTAVPSANTSHASFETIGGRPRLTAFL